MKHCLSFLPLLSLLAAVFLSAVPHAVDAVQLRKTLETEDSTVQQESATAKDPVLKKCAPPNDAEIKNTLSQFDLVDKVDCYKSKGTEATGRKTVTKTEVYFTNSYFLEKDMDKNMPRVLQVEAFAQLASFVIFGMKGVKNLKVPIFLKEIKNITWKNNVHPVPGDTLVMKVTKVKDKFPLFTVDGEVRVFDPKGKETNAMAVKDLVIELPKLK